MSNFRILTIDGGGIKGAFPASFLATVEESIGRNPADYFDLIVGSSTGGIIALGLGLGIPAREIRDFYKDAGPVVFGGNRFIRFLRQWGWSKYETEPLKQELGKHFGDKILGDSKKRLVIPAFDIDRGEVHVYKTRHHARLEIDFRKKAVDVALATAAAPAYFPTFRSAAGTPLVDGGVWANNPIAVGIVEAIGVLGQQPEDIRILSLGCTTAPLDIRHGSRFSLGRFYWGVKAVDIFMAGQSSSAMGTAKLLVGKENILRISPNAPNGKYSLDNIRQIPSLVGMGDAEARDALPRLRSMFLHSPVADFVPIGL